MRKLVKATAAFFASVALLTSPLSMQISEAQGTAPTWGPYRGMNMSCDASDADIKAAQGYGANLVRITFSHHPFLNKTTLQWDPTAFTALDRVIATCENLHLKIVIDPHTTPGTASIYTTDPKDKFWHEDVYQQYLLKTWKAISDRCKNKSIVAGYDLLNEPSFADKSIPGTAEAADWNGLVAKLVKMLRANGDSHWIIVESQVGKIVPNSPFLNRLEGMKYLNLPADSRLVVSPHMYEPHDFTGQGTDNRPVLYTYPGYIPTNGKEVYWDPKEIATTMAPILDFQTRYPNVPVWVGEFSATRNGGKGSDYYVRDVIEVMESHHWNWSYHNFRFSSCFNPELPVGNPLPPGQPSGRTARMQTLRHYFNRNP